jgi:hypothetical protein
MSESQSDALTTSPQPPKIKKKLAGAVGIEPTLEVLETSVLPLNYAPMDGGGRRIRTFEPVGNGFTVRRV